MAGRTLMVDMADDDLIPAWRTVIELAETGISAEWTVVGGPMVALAGFVEDAAGLSP